MISEPVVLASRSFHPKLTVYTRRMAVLMSCARPGQALEVCHISFWAFPTQQKSWWLQTGGRVESLSHLAFLAARSRNTDQFLKKGTRKQIPLKGVPSFERVPAVVMLPFQSRLNKFLSHMS